MFAKYFQDYYNKGEINDNITKFKQNETNFLVSTKYQIEN